MKSYEEITSEVLEAARERRQQMGKKRRITAIAITGAAVVGILALVILLRIPTQRPEVQRQAERQTVTATTAETEAETTAATEAPAEVPTRAPRETRTTKATTTVRTRYTESYRYEEDDDEPQYQPIVPDDDLEDLEHPAAPTQYVEPAATDALHPGTTPAGADPTEHHEQTAAPQPTAPHVVQTDPPIYIEPDPQPAQPDPEPVAPPADPVE